MTKQEQYNPVPEFPVQPCDVLSFERFSILCLPLHPATVTMGKW